MSTTSWWVTATPLGTPVDPDVKITYANWSGWISASRKSSRAPVAASPAVANRIGAPSGRTRSASSVSSSSHSTATLPTSPATNAIRDSGQLTLTGTYTPPAFRTASSATHSCDDRRITTRTRDSAVTPASTSIAASRPGPLVQLPEAQARPAVDHRDRLRVPGHLRREHPRHRRRLHLEGGVVPPVQHQLPLGRRQQVQLADPPGRLGGGLVQQSRQPATEGVHRRLVEQVPGVLERVADPGRRAVGFVLRAEEHAEVELGRLTGQRLGPRLQARHLPLLAGVVVDGEHHLEQRVPRGGPGPG